jgi:hypothetical protein
MKSKSGIGAYILIVLGALFLLSNFRLLPHPFMARWWPLILVLVGIMSLVRRSSREKEHNNHE